MTSGPTRDRSGLAARFAVFERTAGTRAALYARLAPKIATDDDLLGLLDDAPDEQRLPVLLFAAVHLLVLEGRGGDLSAHYPTASPSTAAPSPPRVDDPFPSFRRVALEHAERIRAVVATRATQTNEVGRCAWFMPLAAEVAGGSGPVALIDVGASAGLNLLLDRYSYEYTDEHGRVVNQILPAEGRHGTPLIHCMLRAGSAAAWRPPMALPEVAFAAGIDASPIDVTDDDAVRWLKACIWPGMDDRFVRLSAAIELARTAPPSITRGDAVDALDEQVVAAHAHGHPLVLTSWVLNYLPFERQQAFVECLDRLGAAFDLSWIVAESPAETPGLPLPAGADEDLTVVSLVRWRSGRREVERRATAHPHGYWIRGG